MPKFSIVKHGYATDEVDKYVAALENRLKELKEKESAIQNAIINAQIAADNIIKEAEEKSSDLQEKALFQLDSIKLAVQSLNLQAINFCDDYNQLIEKYLSPIQLVDRQSLDKKFQDLSQAIDNLQKPPAPKKTAPEPVHPQNAKTEPRPPAPKPENKVQSPVLSRDEMKELTK